MPGKLWWKFEKEVDGQEFGLEGDRRKVEYFED
jgi:hypothetical protein